MNRTELIQSREYWIADIQLRLFEVIADYLKKNDLSQTQLAEQLDVTKGYVSQILNGEFDHKISKLVDLSLAVGKVPVIHFQDVRAFEKNENPEIKNTTYSAKETIAGKPTPNIIKRKKKIISNRTV